MTIDLYHDWMMHDVLLHAFRHLDDKLSQNIIWIDYFKEMNKKHIQYLKAGFLDFTL